MKAAGEFTPASRPDSSTQQLVGTEFVGTNNAAEPVFAASWKSGQLCGTI